MLTQEDYEFLKIFGPKEQLSEDKTYFLLRHDGKNIGVITMTKEQGTGFAEHMSNVGNKMSLTCREIPYDELLRLT